jgi:hypothetical protein
MFGVSEAHRLLYIFLGRGICGNFKSLVHPPPKSSAHFKLNTDQSSTNERSEPDSHLSSVELLAELVVCAVILPAPPPKIITCWGRIFPFPSSSELFSWRSTEPSGCVIFPETQDVRDVEGILHACLR